MHVLVHGTYASVIERPCERVEWHRWTRGFKVKRPLNQGASLVLRRLRPFLLLIVWDRVMFILASV